MKTAKKETFEKFYIAAAAVLLNVVTQLCLCAAGKYRFASQPLLQCLVYVASVMGTSLMTFFCCFNYFYKKRSFKTICSSYLLAAIASVIIFVCVKYDLLAKFKSVEQLRAVIALYGRYAVPAFICLQILQVTVLPIPGVVAVATGVVMFGALKGAILSYVGITVGSLIDFFAARKFGGKVIAKIVGKSKLEQWFDKLEGRDKTVITAMFLLPFFPDDLLCFIAGLSTMSTKYYLIMILFTRFISVFSTAYSVGGSIIPYDKWWGVAIWCLLFASAIAVMAVILKKNEKTKGGFKRGAR